MSLTGAPASPRARSKDAKSPKPGTALVEFTSHYGLFMTGDRGAITLTEVEHEQHTGLPPRFRVIESGKPVKSRQRDPSRRGRRGAKID